MVLQEELEKHFKTRIAIKGGIGRRSAFEITGSKPTDAEGTSVTFFSKLKQGGFPDQKTLFECLENYIAKGEILPVAEAKECSIM